MVHQIDPGFYPNRGFYQVGPVQRVETLSIFGVVIF
jgi:hypothetical protein